MTTRILEEMKVRCLFCDGGMGGLFQVRGLKPGELPKWWNLAHRSVPTSIHRSYLGAGADIMTTDTFGANGLRFKENLEPIVTAVMENARTAVRKTGHEYVAPDLGPMGQLLRSLGDLELEDTMKLYKGVVSVDARAGADSVLIETMSDSYELKAVMLAARETGLRPDTGECLPVFATVIFDEKEKLLTGRNVESTVVLLEELRVGALGTNCGLGPIQIKGTLEETLRVSSLPVLIDPNAGLPRNENGRMVYDIDAESSAPVMERIVTMGAVVMRGCCGTTPEHIRLMTRQCKDIPVVWPEKRHRTVVSFYTRAMTVDGKIIVTGGRIDPTGRSKFKQALRDRNLEYTLKKGVSQQDNGADVLNVNVKLPEIHEPSMMEEAVREFQVIIDPPFQIDTPDMGAMERVMHIYSGKPLIDSVSGKEGPMTHVFPLMAKYDGVAVGFCLNESGIPDTTEGRLAVGRKAIDRAAKYGIGPEGIILDGFCITASSNNRGALTTPETLQRIQDELGVGAVLGISNIFFGLPQRGVINAASFTMVMECGLGAVIISPSSEVMMRAYYSFSVLMDLDPQRDQYTNVHSNQNVGLDQITGGDGSQGEIKIDRQSGPGEAGVSQEPAPSAATEKGLKEVVHNAVSVLLKEREPLDIINSEMIPALNRVGKGFEKGTALLPQPLMSTEAAKAAFEVTRVAMDGSGQTQEKKGATTPATVKDDIHGIGKDIIKVLLGNYGCEVIGLGRGVSPKTIVKETMERQVVLVGLSALMTTTTPSMEGTIRQLRVASAVVKVMAGGAVLTEDYARTIGADVYCRDAMASVNYAEQIFGVWSTGELLCFHGLTQESPSI